MKLDSILQLSQTLRQVVTDYTRMDPPSILDPIITTLASYYQTPMCLNPLGPDSNSKCVESDHKSVKMKPINSQENVCSRMYRQISVRPITDSGLAKLEIWFQNQNWESIFNTDCVSQKAVNLQIMVMRRLRNIFP